MQTTYAAKLTLRGTRGRFPKLKGELYENDILVGTFSRGATVRNYVPPIKSKFLTAAAKGRFEDFSDSLSIEETIEALLFPR